MTSHIWQSGTNVIVKMEYAHRSHERHDLKEILQLQSALAGVKPQRTCHLLDKSVAGIAPGQAGGPPCTKSTKLRGILHLFHLCWAELSLVDHQPSTCGCRT